MWGSTGSGIISMSSSSLTGLDDEPGAWLFLISWSSNNFLVEREDLLRLNTLGSKHIEEKGKRRMEKSGRRREWLKFPAVIWPIPFKYLGDLLSGFLCRDAWKLRQSSSAL